MTDKRKDLLNYQLAYKQKNKPKSYSPLLVLDCMDICICNWKPLYFTSKTSTKKNTEEYNKIKVPQFLYSDYTCLYMCMHPRHSLNHLIQQVDI